MTQYVRSSCYHFKLTPSQKSLRPTYELVCDYYMHAVARTWLAPQFVRTCGLVCHEMPWSCISLSLLG